MRMSAPLLHRLLSFLVIAGPVVVLAQQSAGDSVTALCKSMPGMPGCSIDKLCSGSSSTLPSPFCSKESVFADICSDMPSMGDCKSFNTSCSNPSTCKALPGLPSSRTATQQIASICSEMTMDGCSNCKIALPTSGYAECDLLGTYSQLCKAMPEMSQCGAWKALCTSNPTLSYCSTGTASDPPTMKMYFHTGIRDYILFQNAVPETTGGYVVALILIFIFSALYEGYQVFYVRVLDWVETIAPSKIDKDNLVPLQKKAIGAATRATVRIVGATWSYLLMLVTMTFNVGLFLAVVVGLGFGSAIFGPHHSRYSALRVSELQNAELCC